MKTFPVRILCPILIFTLALPVLIFAQELKEIKLPAPRTEGGMPLMEALANRHSDREFSSREIPLQVLSNMLWAGFGINRTDKGGRTAPSAMNWQETDIYVATADGAWLYEPKEHRLLPVTADDIRSMTGTQDFVAGAGANLVYVADYTKMGSGTDAQKEKLAWADASFVAQNVYLFCASAGLNVVVRGLVDREKCTGALKLLPEQHITLAQTVGYPK